MMTNKMRQHWLEGTWVNVIQLILDWMKGEVIYLSRMNLSVTVVKQCNEMFGNSQC